MSAREAVIAEARTWLGTPFHHQGRIKHVGADCVGFVAGVAIASGLYPDMLWDAPEMRPFLGYGHIPDGKSLRQALGLFVDPVPLHETQPADILLMRFHTQPQHLALLTGAESIIHAYAHARQVCEHTLDETWRGRICGAYRMRGIE